MNSICSLGDISNTANRRRQRQQLKKCIYWGEEAHIEQTYRKEPSEKQRSHSRSQKARVFWRGDVFRVSEEFSSPNLELVSLKIDRMVDRSITVV